MSYNKKDYLFSNCIIKMWNKFQHLGLVKNLLKNKIQKNINLLSKVIKVLFHIQKPQKKYLKNLK